MTDLVREFDEGRIGRDDYWHQMRECHMALGAYQALVRRADIEAIEIGANSVVLRLKDGLRFTWRPEDTRSQPSVLINNGEYEREELALLEALTDSFTAVFDIGANAGWYAVHLGQRLRGRGVLWAFEPVPETYAMLRQNVQANGLDETVRTFSFGFSESPGTARFYLPAASGSVAASGRPLFPDDDNEEILVELRTLDEFVSDSGIERIDLIKCDVEGAEILVLKGGMSVLQRLRPVVMLEMLRKWTAVYGYHPNDIVDLMAGIGYSCWTAANSELVRVGKVTDETLETNFFFFDETKHGEALRGLSVAAGLGRPE